MELQGYGIRVGIFTNGTEKRESPSGCEGLLVALHERVGACMTPPKETALRAPASSAQTNDESTQFSLRPGTNAFAGACRELDRRSLGYRVVKRAFDIAFSAFVIAVGFVPCALLSIAIAADTKGSPIYTQERVGRLGRPFRIYKFRSMVVDADDVEKYLTPDQLAQWERERKVDGDPRITRLGRVLRRTSLDELPQFLNVLAGQLSIIGPRAITYDELKEYGSDAPLLLSVPQGVTGSWQAGPRNEATFENGERQAIELDYARHASLGEDARVFLATFGAMFGKRRSGR